jgi:hypothetical protein
MSKFKPAGITEEIEKLYVKLYEKDPNDRVPQADLAEAISAFIRDNPSYERDLRGWAANTLARDFINQRKFNWHGLDIQGSLFPEFSDLEIAILADGSSKPVADLTIQQFLENKQLADDEFARSSAAHIHRNRQENLILINWTDSRTFGEVIRRLRDNDTDFNDRAS